MSFKKIVMHTVICDLCGVDSSEDSDYSCFESEMEANDEAENVDWHILGKKHYCTGCFTYHDNTGNIILKDKYRIIYNSGENIGKDYLSDRFPSEKIALAYLSSFEPKHKLALFDIERIF